MKYDLHSSYSPTGDQPEAIAALTDNIKCGVEHQTLLGVTGSGKTFTMANVIANVGKPTLVLSHNKTLAAQLYSEFKAFFPNNAVEYFVSYYDYYQPEAYIPTTDTYIEKDLAINAEIDRLRLATIASLLSKRDDVIVVSSVSCLYGIGNPADFEENCIELHQGQIIDIQQFLLSLVNAQYARNDIELERGKFRVKGNTIDIGLSYVDTTLRITLWDDEIDSIVSIDPLNGVVLEEFESFSIYPSNIFVTTEASVARAIEKIEADLKKEEDSLRAQGKEYEAKRLHERVTYDMEMIKEVGYCSGVENYSRYFDGREPGTPPYCLFDYFPDDYLLIVDESHVTIPQIHAMYGGDAARKRNLVEYGFRLEAAKDNRPLKFEEFEQKVKKAIYVSATPADYELVKSQGLVIEQIIRPTGLLDPKIEVRPTKNQVDDLMEEIRLNVEADERVLVTTLTKRMAEELSEYLIRAGVRCRYIHSDVDTLERVEILNDLRNGLFDVLIGVNLLREGLDLPSVSLVAILDADKEGFLRNKKSLTQTAGRAARNVNGRVIMYGDKITESMRLTIEETERRRVKQMQYNKEHNITPQSTRSSVISGAVGAALKASKDSKPAKKQPAPQEPIYQVTKVYNPTDDPVIRAMSKEEIAKLIAYSKKQMEEAARKLDFISAARWRDEMLRLQEVDKG